MNHMDIKRIGGVIAVTVGYEPRLYAVQELEKSNSLTIGQLFNAVRSLNGKSIADYGDKWPKFSNGTSTVSGKFTYIQEAFKACTSDLERLRLTCEQLGEELPELIDRDEIKKRIDAFLSA